MSDTLVVNEIYKSIQGESSWVGLPCVFVRLTACDLRCTWCDTAYAFYEGHRVSLDEIVDRVVKLDCPLVEITGGEPLLQAGVLPLMTRLCDLGKRVLIETSGAHDISGIDPRVVRIMDLKCPGSGEVARNLYANIAHLRAQDEVKFVIADRADYEWAREKLREHELSARCNVLFSPVWGRLDPQRLVGWILEDKLPVRFQLQLHKLIWDPKQRGV
jgi:7-carboxy-7-deazaguanine synthase